MFKEILFDIMQQKSYFKGKEVSNGVGVCTGIFWNSALAIVYQRDQQIGVS